MIVEITAEKYVMIMQEFLDQTGVSFPERIKYEDNYWGNIVTVYIRKIAFIEEILYFYRRNSNSTTHTAKYSYDRILIERSLLQEVKRRGLFEKYHDGWEYIFITRHAWTTSCMLCSANQMTDFKAVRAIYQDLWREFPMWWKNHYYVKSQGVKRKTAQFLMAVFPSAVGYLLHNYLKMRQYTIKKAGDKSDATVT